jgi:hypothetical protein
VVGLVVEAHALVALGRIELAVTRYDGTIRKAHDEGWIVAPAVGIDQQP